MGQTPPSVLQVNTHDSRGGAARVAMGLHRAFRDRGIDAWLAVGRKQSDVPGVLRIPNEEGRSLYTSRMLRASERIRDFSGKIPGAWRLGEAFRNAADPKRWRDVARGREDFSFPATWSLLDLPPRPPDIVHCHNLHGEYFDLRALPEIARQKPLVMTLHDSWLLGGHCAHPLACDLWETGCRDCPDLSIYPSIRKDATAYNWQRKRDIYSGSRLHVGTPSRWLMDKVDRSILGPAVRSSRVIPNGVDLSVFRPGGMREARGRLGLPEEARILLFAADWLGRNVFKDFETIRDAVARTSGKNRKAPLLFLAVGDRGGTERAGSAEIRILPYQPDPAVMADCYRGADLYLHAAKVETFPLTVLEALACGTPVIATAVGGIPEIVRSLTPWGREEGTRPDDPTGILVPPRDGASMAEGIDRLLEDEGLRRRLGENAARDARGRFDLAGQAQAYLDWYEEIRERFPPSTG